MAQVSRQVEKGNTEKLRGGKETVDSQRYLPLFDSFSVQLLNRNDNTADFYKPRTVIKKAGGPARAFWMVQTHTIIILYISTEYYYEAF